MKEGILIRFIRAYLQGEISALFFCDEFTLLYTRYEIEVIEQSEFNKVCSEQEEFIYANITDWCFRYSESELDFLKSNWFITEIELKKQVSIEFEKLKLILK